MTDSPFQSIVCGIDGTREDSRQRDKQPESRVPMGI